MLLLLRRSVPVSARACRRLYSTTPRQPLPEPPAVRELDSLESRQLAREWIARLEQSHYERIPKDWLAISYSRSSGPGGQNVNKLSTKATVRLGAMSLSRLLPPYAFSFLRATSNYYTSSHGGGLLCSSSAHRTQPDNLRLCMHKIWAELVRASKADLAGETSAAQKDKVATLVKKEKSKLVKVKKMRKDVKAGRRGGGGGGWD